MIDWLVGLSLGCESHLEDSCIFTRDVISVGRYFKDGVNVRIDDSVGWGVDRVVGDIVLRGADI